MTLIMNDMGEFVDPEEPVRHLKLSDEPDPAPDAPPGCGSGPKPEWMGKRARRCDVCGSWFEPRDSRHKRCSRECSRAANARRDVMRYRKAGPSGARGHL